MTEPTLLGTALAYARRGWPVHPLTPRDKTPLTKWKEAATTNEAQIRLWWAKWPDANIGIPTGRPETFDAADFDDPVALPVYRQLCREQPGLPRVLTGGGGRHLLFASTGRATTKEKGYEWRGVGSYVVAAGSVHASGRRYSWIVRPNGQLPTGPMPAPVPASRSERSTLAELLAGPPDDPRKGNDWLTAVAGHLAKLHPYRDSYDLNLAAINASLSDPLTAEDVTKVADSIWTTEHAKPDDFEKRVAVELETQRVRDEARRRLRSAGWLEPARPDATLTEESPEPEHLGVGGFLLLGSLVWLFGEPEAGKSLLAYDAGVREMHAGRAVALFDAEAGERDIRQKMRALGATTAELARLHIYDVSSTDLQQNPGWALARFAEIGARLAIFDSAPALLAVSGLNEDKNAEVLPFIQLVFKPLKTAGGCVVVTDHVTKADPTSRYPRAAGAKLGESDLAFNVSAPEPFARGRSGRLRLRCEKDRSGWIGQKTQYDVGVTASDGRLVFEASKMTLTEAATLKARAALDRFRPLLKLLATKARTVEELIEPLGLTRSGTSRLLNDAKEAGLVTDEGPRQGLAKTWCVVTP